jgi:predicted metalloendopeptidase
MTPPTTNAYYDAQRNERLPAGILQPPGFTSAIDAVNYGSIGRDRHEISHGFDDHGRSSTPRAA